MKQKRVYRIFFIGLIIFGSCSGSGTKESNAVNATPIKDTVMSSSSTSNQSEITCPKCGNKKMETLPTDVCLIKYNCANCDTILFPKEGDCCVFCTYGTHKCPSKQDQ